MPISREQFQNGKMQFQFDAFEHAVYEFFRAHPDTAVTMVELFAYLSITPKPAYPLDFRQLSDQIMRVHTSKHYTSLQIGRAVENLVDWKLVHKTTVKQLPQERRYPKRSHTYYILAR